MRNLMVFYREEEMDPSFAAYSLALRNVDI